ncbi:MAG: TonB-dependent receptor [Ignavibacteriae bacterium]|nr:TonB-dependent receptor [Ignavibacteriota bacterium]NOG96724.1 TonB-dependent receptor [Ignavibacteriota bacterium]
MPIFINKISLAILFVLLSLTTSIKAQTGGITGKVTSSGDVLPGVNILIIGTNFGGVSDEKGIYIIRNLPVGEVTARFSAVGYKSEFIDVELIANRILELNVDLDEMVIEVDEVKVIDSEVQKQSDTRSSLIDLQPAQARVLPGAVTDVFRTLQSLPGVLAPNDFSSQLVIRGSGPDQNLIVMDDVEVFNPYRLYGVISMFNPEAVSDVSLITGGFPVRYGDRLSAVLDVTNKQGTTSRNIKGNLNASIVAANLVLEGKNPFNLPGSWLINSRRTYYDLIIEPFVKNAGLVEDNVTFPNFYDVQTKIALGPFKGHKIFLNAIYSRDAVDLVSGEDRNTPDSISVFDNTKNDLASIAWHFTPKKNFLNKVIVSWYRNSGDSKLDSEFLDPSLNRENFEDAVPDTLAPYLLGFGFKSDFSYRKYSIDDKLLILWNDNENEFEAGAGIDFMRTKLAIDFDIDPELQSFLSTNPNLRIVLDDISDIKDYSRYRIYAHNRFKIGDRLYIKPGLRLDYYQILEKPYLAPRLSISYALNNLTTIRAGWGIYYQSPGYEKLRDANVLYDLDQRITSKLDAERAVHYVLSFERWLSSEWKAKIEGYFKKFDNLIVQKIVPGSVYYTEKIPGISPRDINGWTRPIINIADSLTQIPTNDATGEAYGFEFLVEKKNIMGDNKISGWLSYALAYAERYEDSRMLPFRFDQRHTLNLVLNYQINHWLDVGIRFQYGSGFPVTTPVGIKPRIILQDQNGDFVPETPVIATRINTAGEQEVIYDVDYGDRFNRFASRKPIYHRLDLRFNASADWWDLDWVIYLDIINVYNRSNVVNYDYYISEDLTLEREATGMFPILPTFGFNLRF